MGGKMARSLKHGALAALALTSLVLSVLVLAESDLNAKGKRHRGRTVFDAANPPAAVSALVEASQFTAYGQVGIDGSARGNKLTVKAKPFDSRLKFTGDDKKFVVKKIPPDPIGPVSAFPKLFVKPVKSSQQSLSDDVIGTAPAFKLEAGKNAVFKKGDELFKNTGPIPTEVKLFVPPKDPVKFNYRLKKLGADGGTKVATFSSPAASFAAMAEDINQKKKGGKTGRLRRSMDGQIANAKPPTPARFELQIDFKQGEPVRAKIKAQSKKSKKKSKPKSKR